MRDFLILLLGPFILLAAVLRSEVFWKSALLYGFLFLFVGVPLSMPFILGPSVLTVALAIILPAIWVGFGFFGETIYARTERWWVGLSDRRQDIYYALINGCVIAGFVWWICAA